MGWRIQLCLLVLGVEACLPVVAHQARIPAVKSVSMAGDTVELPDALRGKVGVLVLGFSKGSQGQVTTWGRRLAAEWKDSASVVYYEMPMLAGVPRMLRGMVTRSMKSSIPERAQSRFVPITSDEDAWRALAHYSKGDDAYVLVVDGEGRVVWQTQGGATDAAFAGVKERVAGLRGASEARK